MKLTDDEVLELLQRMDAGYIPTEEERSALADVRRLRLYGRKLETLPDSIGCLTGLTSLGLSDNRLTSLPNSIGNLSKLTYLSLRMNQLTSLPESFGNLTELSILKLYRNNLTSLPESFGNLTGLTDLDLDGNRLTSLPESIGNLTALTSLDLFGNHLTSLPETFGKMTELTRLNLSGNRLTSLPETFGNLTRLTNLSLSGNRLTSLPESIGNLTTLTSLGLSCNRLTSLPKSIGNLSQLKYLGLRMNQLTSLPESFGKMTELTRLNLSGNRLTSLPDCMEQLKSLKQLILWFYHWDKLPAFLLNLNLPFLGKGTTIYSKNNSGIFLADTTLSLQPVSLFDQTDDESPGRSASRKLIEDYFHEEHIPLRESKVILLGDAAAGKTYTVRRLKNNCEKGKYRTKTTHGILIEDLQPVRDGAPYTVRIWDFGGQDIMNEMHRCFLTERTCYVILVDTRNNGQTQRARKWLRTVRSVAPDAPVVLLVNEMTGSVNLDLDSNTLMDEFPNLKEVHHCSAVTAEQGEFRREVEEPILRHALGMDSCKMTLPKSWDAVRRDLLKLRDDKFYVDRTGFHQMCDDHGVPKDDQLRVWLLNWFNDMGVCFSYHFEDGKERSEDYKILEPKWLTSAIYRLLWEKGKNESGIITRTEIDLILRQEGSKEKQQKGVPCLPGVKYSEEEQNYVLDIMRKFSLSYPANDFEEFMPLLCETDSRMNPTPEQPRQHISVRFVYELLPESVIHRLMIYCYKYLCKGRCWRTGFWLENKEVGLSAVVHTPSEENTLQVDVYAENEFYDVSEWLQPLCKQVGKINDSLNLKAEQEVKAENEKGSQWFKLDKNIWYLFSEGETRIWGDQNRYDILPLLELLYGRWFSEARNLHGAETLPEIDKEPERTLEASIPELIDALNRNTDATNKNTSALQHSTRQLERICSGDYSPSEKLIETLFVIIEQNYQHFESVELIRTATKPTKLERLQEFLEVGANLATLAPLATSVFSILTGQS